MYKMLLMFFCVFIIGCTFIANEHSNDREYKIRLAQNSVNSYMTYKKEDVDMWDNTCPKTGDCEDFALCKSRKLQQMGIDKKDIKLMVGITKIKGVETSHAVLVVDDKLVLDNMYPDVVEKDVFLKHFRPLYTCHSEYYGAEFHDFNLMILLTKNPGFDSLIHKKCEAMIIEEFDI